MVEETPFVGEPADSREAIMRATHRALREHGYAGLSIQRIADEAALSKSTFYHHYDDKADLLASFVDYVLEEFMRIFSLEAGDDPRENLRTFIDFLTYPGEEIDRELPEDLEAVLRTYVELRTLAARDEAIRKRFTETDSAFNAQLAEIIQSGIDAGEFEPIDPERTATFIGTVLAGNTYLRTTTGDHDMDALRTELDHYVSTRIVT